jgi:hypothetical protein
VILYTRTGRDSVVTHGILLEALRHVGGWIVLAAFAGGILSIFTGSPEYAIVAACLLLGAWTSR